MLKPDTKVVGVTFENRQNTLRELRTKNPWRSVSLIHTTYHNPDTGEDEPAIQVKDYETKKELGWIARTEIANYSQVHEMTAELGEYEGTEYCHLYSPKAPTQKQYWAMRKICQAQNQQMPIYDERAYEPVFAMSRANQING